LAGLVSPSQREAAPPLSLVTGLRPDRPAEAASSARPSRGTLHCDSNAGLRSPRSVPPTRHGSVAHGRIAASWL
jgi:hypothetical protein